MPRNILEKIFSLSMKKYPVFQMNKNSQQMDTSLFLKNFPNSHLVIWEIFKSIATNK